MVETSSQAPSPPTAELSRWGLVNVGFASDWTTHAVGVVVQHPALLPGRTVHTSPVIEVSPDRTWLRAQSRVWKLIDEQPELSLAVREKLVMALWAGGGRPYFVEWLRPDGHAYAAWTRRALGHIVSAAEARADAQYDAMIQGLSKGS